MHVPNLNSSREAMTLLFVGLSHFKPQKLAHYQDGFLGPYALKLKAPMTQIGGKISEFQFPNKLEYYIR